MSAVQTQAIEEGPLVPNEAAYERDKAAANAGAARRRAIPGGSRERGPDELPFLGRRLRHQQRTFRLYRRHRDEPAA